PRQEAGAQGPAKEHQAAEPQHRDERVGVQVGALPLGGLQDRVDDPVLVRVHTENVTCDMFGSTIDDTGYQLRRALEKIAEVGQGLVLYLRQSEHGLDLIHQLRTYSIMQERGISKRDASAETGYGLNRDYGVGAQILHELGLRRILLLTNHPPKVTAIEGFDLEVVGNVPLGTPASEVSGPRAGAEQMAVTGKAIEE
ncbi:MAG: hypothetical protein ACXW18_12450, partial [Pyrinomonadaceae bacterium]